MVQIIPSLSIEPSRQAAPSEKTPPALISMMTDRDRVVFFCFVALWCALLVQFWLWWLQPEHNIGTYRYIINTLLVGWTTLLPAYYLMIVSRAKISHPGIHLPGDWRVAMVVTKAPSEPVDLIKKTLLAMIDQNYPHDTWLADEDPSQEIIDWCNLHNVRISSRKGHADYHQATWPRRTKCKEGNLAYFYDHFGYDNYDFVIQLDADHVPTRGYLEEILRPFIDPRVGYVSAPSICDANAESSWCARGRLHLEAGLHGALQAGYTNGFAPLCIGSHYAVRTSALKEIGGLGPELAEDHSTTLLMNSGGWRGVHAMNAIAHGDGPANFSDMITQEFQWARSLVTILIRYTPKYFGSLPLALKFQFLFCQLLYVFYSLSLLASVVLPLVALVSGKPWVGIVYVQFLLQFFLLGLVLLLLNVWFRYRGWLRPTVPVFSWESFFFAFARWPWTLLGVVMAIYDCIRGTTSQFRVTPKGNRKDEPLPFIVIAPYGLISAISGGTVLLVSDAGNANGFYILAIINCILYLVLMCVVIVRHSLENANDGVQRSTLSLLTTPNTLAAGSVLLILLFATPLRLSQGIEGILWGAQLPQTSVSGKLATVVTGPDSIKLGIYDWNASFGNQDFIAIEHVFISWKEARAEYFQQLANIVKHRNRWPLITIEPWSDGREGTVSLLQAVNEGKYDDLIRGICSNMAQMNIPVLVRFAHEMEVPTGRYPWADSDNIQSAKAFRRFVDTCRSYKADFYYVWSPRGDGPHARYYPGAEYVDFVGLSVYSYSIYEVATFGRIRSFEENFGEKYATAKIYNKPIIIAELGVDGNSEDQRSWLLRGFSSLDEFPLLKSIIYFNGPDSVVWEKKWPKPDWTIDRRVFTTPGEVPLNR